ncbi:hypothetical protein DFA_09174 [Cavenderia fasciculata]|uniref:Monalysin Pore-forming domain-containing protein n=1 Tax=Cavenderia fasciculata TaxID=261658 RepID=F4Q6W7_CACFS|nr:uncharacterized protein DFA_09174 [Cavenderia fasciculata]EGG16149.1 hypothetical protein DFA_09174 [Cavenderia fasciculata]|eukprot:XP_004352602.1 hypothetical protein DFA_09174 [Cavenderia fasciculata]
MQQRGQVETDNIIPLKQHHQHDDEKKKNQTNQKFDIENSLVVSSDYGVDLNLKSKNPIDQMVITSTNFEVTYVEGGFNVKIKPIGVYNRFVQNVNSTSNQTISVTYKTGFAPGYRIEPGPIARCESLHFIKHKFPGYATNIPDETSVSKGVTVGVGQYTINQTLLVYGLVKTPVSGGGAPTYSIVSLYRDDLHPTYQSSIIDDPCTDDEVKTYLLGRGLSRWL